MENQLGPTFPLALAVFFENLRKGEQEQTEITETEMKVSVSCV
jgi:hypothetical protein